MLGGVLDEPVQGQRDGRGRLGRHLGQDVHVRAVLIDADHPPARFAVQLVLHGLLDLVDDCGGESLVSGQHLGLRGDHDTGQRVERPGHLVVIGGPQRDQIQRAVGRAGLFGQPLRVESVVELPQNIGDHPRARHQRASGADRVELVAVQLPGDEHLGATEFVDRGAPGRVGTQLEGLVLTEFGVQRAGAPAHHPLSLVAHQVQHAVIGPGSILGQFPGESVVHTSGVLGVARAENLGVEVARLQSRPCLVERFMGLCRTIAELGGRAGVAATEIGEELLGGRGGTVGAGGARRHRSARGHGRQQQPCDFCDS